MDRLFRHFSIAGILAVAVATALAALLVSGHFAIGVLVGGALGLVNFRGLMKNMRGLDINDPKPSRLMLAGGARLLLLLGVVTLIAATGRVDLLGLAAGFTVAVLVVVVTGVLEMRRLVAEEPLPPIGPPPPEESG